MKDYIKLIRVKHWIKNILVFSAVFFSGNIFNKSILINIAIAWAIFSMVSSIVYIINDINDIENDRKNPAKQNRPLASGRISVKNAKITVIVLFAIAVFLSTVLYRLNNNVYTYIIPLAYLTVNIFYSKGLKNLPIIDVVILVSGFVLRVIYGGVTTNIEVSKWLYMMVTFGSFFLAYGKRRNEIIKNGTKARSVLKYYNKDFLDKNMYVALTLAIASYSLWTIDKSTIQRVGNENLFWTIPLVMIIFQQYSLSIEGNSDGDPTEVLLSNKGLLFTTFIYLLSLVVILYI